MTDKIVAKEYWAKKGDVDLYVYRKFDGSPEDKPVLFLVHGSSLSAVPGFDLQVPGRGSQYSVMDRCAMRGYDVWTMDHEGYGKSSKTTNNANISQGADDLSAAMALIERETGRASALFYGQSSGSLRATLFAQREPHRVERLVLDAFVWTGEGSVTLSKRRERLDEWRTSHVRKIDRDSIISIFTRDKPGVSESVVAETVADAQLSLGDMIPTGTYLDMCANLPVVDPQKVEAPALIIRGEHDGLATMEDLCRFLVKLPNNDKQLTVLAGSAHIAPFGLNADCFYHVMFAFLEMPVRKEQ